MASAPRFEYPRGTGTHPSQTERNSAGRVSSMRREVEVIIVDSHPMFRDGLAQAISSDPRLQLVGETDDGREAVALAARLEPEVAVVDVSISGSGGAQLLRDLRANKSQTGVLFISGEVNGHVVHEAVAAGARAFLSRRAERREICEAILKIARGELLVDPRIEHELLTTIQRQASSRDAGALTERETEILRLAAEGQATGAIASELHLSPETIKSNLKVIFEKLGVSSRTAAVASAFRLGLID
jgi:two-component system, NarL family, nitrate/nitrite response regulator NarL